jgi:hypothetical protein
VGGRKKHTSTLTPPPSATDDAGADGGADCCWPPAGVAWAEDDTDSSFLGCWSAAEDVEARGGIIV